MALHRGIHTESAQEPLNAAESMAAREMLPHCPPWEQEVQQGVTDPFDDPCLRASFQQTPGSRPPAASCWVTAAGPVNSGLSSQQALVCLQAGFHQAWLGAQESLPSVFGKSLCINIKHFYSLHTTLAELSILMFPSRADTQLRWL